MLRVNPKIGFTLVRHQGHEPATIMSFIHNLLQSIRAVLAVETQNDADERFLSDAIDHADLERRIAVQSRAYMTMAPLNIGR